MLPFRKAFSKNLSFLYVHYYRDLISNRACLTASTFSGRAKSSLVRQFSNVAIVIIIEKEKLPIKLLKFLFFSAIFDISNNNWFIKRAYCLHIWTQIITRLSNQPILVFCFLANLLFKTNIKKSGHFLFFSINAPNYLPMR